MNPTFSLGIWTFANLRNFLTNNPQSFLGLTPTGALDRYWRFTFSRATFRTILRSTRD